MDHWNSIPIEGAGVVTFTTHGEGDEASATVMFRGVGVTITARSAEMNEAKGTKDGTLLVLIDTEFEEATTVSVQINDDDTFEGEIYA